MKFQYKYCLIPLIFLSLFSCRTEKKHQKNPTDIMIRDMENEPVFDIVLYDMQDNSGIFSSEYLHQYTIIKERDTILVNDSTGMSYSSKVPYSTKTKWMPVSKPYFKSQVNNMGMVIVSKDANGKISKVASPLGYSRYVGNSHYGYWGGGGWHFFTQYMFMRAMFGGGSFFRSNYTDYNRNYRGQSSYYGKTATGTPKYGTKSSAMQSRMRSGTSKYRSGSRYGSGSSRSRGGGFGK